MAPAGDPRPASDHDPARGARDAGRAGGIVRLWRRTDSIALERLVLHPHDDGLQAHGTIVGAHDGGYVLEHRWWLDSEWHPRHAVIARHGADGDAQLVLERDGTGWRVDGRTRADLDGATLPDLSLTPFCNTLALRALAPQAGAVRELDVAYVDGATLAVTRSRQRYVRLDATHVRYVDLGVARGFEAELEVDALGLVVRYEHLFERVTLVG